MLRGYVVVGMLRRCVGMLRGYVVMLRAYVFDCR